ncbi:MAG: hypothetical protein M3680_12735 [Myxococcota bacterium]|nr:hypothetical protein [Myxococcota bacterium]
MRTYLPFLLLGCFACGGDDGGNTSGADASTDSSGTTDAGVDGPVAPAMITLTGTATARSAGGAAPVADAVIAAYRDADEATPIAMTTTSATGTFTLTVPTGGVALDGFLKATKAGFVVSYLYAPAPIATDTTMLPMNMLTTGNYGTVYALAGVGEEDAKGTIAVVVTDAANMPVAGATVSSTPAATYKYNGANGLPSSSATATAADGVAYMMNAPLGAVTVTAAKAGSTFAANGVKAFDGALTTTLIVPQ